MTACEDDCRTLLTGAVEEVFCPEVFFLLLVEDALLEGLVLRLLLPRAEPVFTFVGAIIKRKLFCTLNAWSLMKVENIRC